MMIVIDSEFESLIPPLTNDEYKLLEESILTEGFHTWEPIITWNGTIIDGHNRYHICDEYGIKFTTREMQFESREAAKIWIMKNQLRRRNLSKYDRSVLALKLEPMIAEEAKKRMSAGGGDKKSGVQKSSPPIEDTGKTRDKLAEIAGVSHDTLRKVKVIETEVEKGNETAIEAREAVKNKKKSINKAYQEVRPKGDKSDERMLCTVCGKPIDDGDHYDHDRNKHKACAYKLEKQRDRKRTKPQFTEDGRRICSICGKPIEEGKHYQDKLNWCYECGLKHANEVQRKYRDADRDLRENVAVYTIDSLVAELTASAVNMRDAIAQSIEINESMGVKVASRQKDNLNKAIEKVFKSIERMRG